jgi:hypothetical protein
MYKRLLFFILFFQFQTAAAQLVKGAVSYYPKGPYQVTHEESLARIEINGGFDYKLKGFLNFEKENINFAVGGEGKEEVYMRLNFESKSRKLNTVIEDYKYMYYHFTMLDSRGIKIYVDYYPGKVFGTPSGIFVVSSIEDKYMYFMKANIEEAEINKIIERYR